MRYLLKMSLLKETLIYSTHNKLTRFFVLVNLLNNIILTTIISDFTVRISKSQDEFYLLPYILGLTLLNPIISRFIVSKLSN